MNSLLEFIQLITNRLWKIRADLGVQEVSALVDVLFPVWFRDAHQLIPIDTCESVEIDGATFWHVSDGGLDLE